MKFPIYSDTFSQLYLTLVGWLVVCLGFYGASTFLGYFMPNPFLYKLPVLFQTIPFSMSTQFNCQKQFLYQTIQFSISMLFKYQNSSISNNLV